MRSPEENPAPERRPRAAVLVGACVAVGLVLRALEARTSLWLDELHTLFVAATPGARELNDILVKDTHTPLYYLAVQQFHGLVPAEDLRWISIVVGLLALLPLWAMARAAGLGSAGRLTVAGLFCTLPFQIQWGVELRPYAWLQLAAATLAWAAFTPATSRRGALLRFAVFAAATAFGLYTHLFTAIAVLGIGAARLVVRRAQWLSIGKLVLAGALGVALFLPWLRSAHPWLFENPAVLWTDEAGVRDPAATAERETPEDAPADAELEQDLAEARGAERNWSRQKLAQVPAQLLVPRVGTLGGTAARVARVGLAGLVALAALLFAAALGPRRRAIERELVGPALAAIATSALLAFVCIRLVNRIPLQYFVVVGWVWPLVFGALVDRLAPARRRGAAALVLALSTAAGAAQALGAPREPLDRATRVAVEEATRRDAWLTAVMWQPDWYESGTVFRVYAPDSGWREPQDVPGVDQPGGEQSVVVLTRNAPDDGITNWRHWSPLRRGRERTERIDLGGRIVVYVYDERAPDERR